MTGVRDRPPSRGHKKRARTLQQLLDAAMELLAVRGEAFSIAELTAEAGVSHGTFYNYFSDRDDVLRALVPHVVGRFADRMADEVVEEDPAARFARISARALDTARHEPVLVRVALRIDDVQRGLLTDGPLSHLRKDLDEGHDRGRFTCRGDQGTLDVVSGSLLLAAARVARGNDGPDYRISVLNRLLQALGVPALEAECLARDAVMDAERDSADPRSHAIV